jgi:hypothetical protein
MDSWIEMDRRYFAREMVFCEEEYYALSEGTRDQTTLQQYAALRNPRWRKDEVAYWVEAAERKRAITARWKEAKSNPAPIRSMQLCYSCKVPWEPDYRCRGKVNKHIIEVHYDSDDEVCEDGLIDAYLEQSDDESDSCTGTSDGDSCTEDDDFSTLKEDDDPCIVDRQSGGQDDSTSTSADISHGVDDLTPQQNGDTSEDSHVLAPTDDQPPMMVVTHMSSFQTPLIATSHEEVSDMSNRVDEPCVRDEHHRHVDPPIEEEIQGVQTVGLTHTDQHEGIESHFLETPLVDKLWILTG